MKVLWLALGEVVEVGLWCEGCLLPAGVRWVLRGYDEDGFVPMGTVVRCAECGGSGGG